MSSSHSVGTGRYIAIAIAAAAVLSACSAGSGNPPTPATTLVQPSPTTASAASPSAAAGPATVAMGTFHAVDGQAAGTAALLHLGDGTFEISLEDFSVPSAAHTNVVLVRNRDVAKTTDVDQNAILDLGPLKGPTGMQDFALPASATTDAMGYHAVVLWDTGMLHAVAVAPLKP